MLVSDCRRELVERRGNREPGKRVDAEFVVATSEVLHERMASDDNRRGPISFEAAHRSKPGLESSVVGFDPTRFFSTAIRVLANPPR